MSDDPEDPDAPEPVEDGDEAGDAGEPEGGIDDEPAGEGAEASEPAETGDPPAADATADATENGDEPDATVDEDADDTGDGDVEDTTAQGDAADADDSDEPDATVDEDADDTNDDDEADGLALDEEGLTARLDDAEAALEEAETEADLDEVATTLDAVGTALEEADLPEPDDEDEDEEAPAERLESRLADLRDALEAERGPYLEDVTTLVETAEGTVADSEWTDDGAAQAVAAVRAFLTAVDETGAVNATADLDGIEEAAAVLETARDQLEGVDLDPDEDADLIADLLDAGETLETDLEDAEVWDDLTVREQLDAEGFYDVLNPENRKDFPPEWNAIKLYEKAGDVEPILRALELLSSDFMEENALDALEHIAPPEAFEPLHERAQKRHKQCIRILGRIGDERACETLQEFLGGGDFKLELVTLRALGSIGSEDSTQAVANRLVADNPDVRSAAARALGLIGDTRAIAPLAETLADDDADEVRASAAWALVQIGTERALEEAAAYADDRSYIVQAEAEKAAGV